MYGVRSELAKLLAEVIEENRLGKPSPFKEKHEKRRKPRLQENHGKGAVTRKLTTGKDQKPMKRIPLGSMNTQSSLNSAASTADASIWRSAHLQQLKQAQTQTWKAAAGRATGGDHYHFGDLTRSLLKKIPFR